jgi:hypothetical protein
MPKSMEPEDMDEKERMRFGFYEGYDLYDRD